MCPRFRARVSPARAARMPPCGIPKNGRTARGKGNPIRKTVSGDGRVRHFNAAMKELVEGVPVNVVLFPMEGDPTAPSLYWKLAVATSGSYLSPSRDWP